ncbi:MAG: threonine aldolase family protein [Candidatus Avilachnospira sp.]
MIMFNCDYLEGAHPEILKRLSETNMVQTPGYGVDSYCDHARELIRKQVGDDKAYVQFLVGGTQTNMTVLAYLMRHHEGVIAADTGHIAVHETGSVEATGHKVLTIANSEGKITAKQVDDYVNAHNADEMKQHMVKPKVVFIGYATEEGTLYSKKELMDLYDVCKKHDLYLYVDGARMGYGLTSEKSDLTMKDIYDYSDVFYIGGTKVGALFGEAIVFKSTTPHDDFRYLMKQKGGLMAKGRLLGIQFETLFDGEGEDCLYYQISAHANRLAMKFKNRVKELGIELYQDSFTNQQFPIFTDELLEKLSKDYSFNYWCRVDDTHSAVRVCTSWATLEENVDRLLADIEKYM